MSRCPGQTPRRELTSVELKCPSCGRIVELFSDEPKVRCRCGNVLRQECLPNCAEWCPAAGSCFGDSIDVRILQERMSKIENDPEAHACVDRIRMLLEESQKLHPDGR